MKFFIYTLIFTATIILSVTGLMGNAKNIPNLEISQNSTTTKQRTPLNLLVPDLVTVSLNQESYTGKLTSFNANYLTIEGHGGAEKILISQVKEMNFKGDVWVKNSDGTIRRFPWRDSSKILQELPTNAFKLDKNAEKATLDLESLSDEGFSRFSQHLNKNYGIKAIFFESSEKMAVKIMEID
ncbi:hypothetical protein [Crocosphaera sp.]|uniref:hypothetical protein n=1 Tax=Crocosphaera sp. TaxID=2729996 RepID=UPI002602AAB1|nr:hypothetical protein [Crocosphaera sp.]MDJ0580470.1 hypothetical protein [Crocosphaera sp.]